MVAYVCDVAERLDQITKENMRMLEKLHRIHASEDPLNCKARVACVGVSTV